LKVPLAEQPIVKDKWFHQERFPHPKIPGEKILLETTVLTYPTIEDHYVRSSARILFGGSKANSQERYPDPEVQGGHIALIAPNNNKVHRTPNSLDRIHASLPKQVAYNQRVLSAEEEVAGINCDIADFLSNLSANPSEPVIVCVNAESGLKRREQHLAGQLLIQGDRKMTATNKVPEGITNDADSATLAGVAEAVEWTHALEEDMEKRVTRRIVIYPTTLTEFTRVLSGEQSNIVDGHEIAYNRISAAYTKYQVAPVFSSADSVPAEEVDPAKVSLWMHTAAQVSVGGRSQVLENRPDVCNFESDSDNEYHGESLKGMYTLEVPVDAKGQPILAKCRLTPTQNEIIRLPAVLKSSSRRQSSSDYTSTSGSESEDSVDEF
jgi:hypothetical protein